ncbi:MAG: hypothetical protein ABIH23_11400, partial [bacterium]
MKEKVLVVVGLLWIILGVLCNEWILGKIVGSDGLFESGSIRLAIWGIEGLFFGWGVVTLACRRRDVIAKLNLLWFTLCVFLPISGEIFLRLGISLDVEFLRDPHLYADHYSDDNYWKLQHRWVKALKLPTVDEFDPFFRRSSVHPLLGWAPLTTPENPLGIVREIPYEPIYDGKVILFYGDSFVFGATEMEQKIPQQLNRLLPEYTVYNYGVGGYGVDQIYLRFKQSYEKFQSPLIIFGILTTDLDRSILTVRSYQKPYYKIENDELVLHGVPINMNPEEWLEQNPPRIYSYLGAFLFRRLCLLGSEGVRIE